MRRLLCEKEIEALKKILEFTEKWNKKDDDQEIANAANILEDLIENGANYI